MKVIVKLKRAITNTQRVVVDSLVDLSIGTGIIQPAKNTEYLQRLEICNQCSNLTSERKCSICKCFVDSKVKIQSQNCPLNKW